MLTVRALEKLIFQEYVIVNARNTLQCSNASCKRLGVSK